MIQVVLNKDQTKAVRNAKGAVEFLDERGKLVGYMARPASDEVIAEAKRRLNSDGPWHTTREVLEHHESLEQG